MSTARIRASRLHGRLTAPPSKSYTHRFTLLAHLSELPGRVRRPLWSADTLRTAKALRQLGSRIELGRGSWTVHPGAAAPSNSARVVDCGESGTTLRLVTAAGALQSGRFRFVGAGRLPHRPMRPLFAALRELGARITPDRSGTLLPFELLGPIHGGSVALKVEKSSQFTSALLLALPKVRPDSTIHVVGTPVSEPYVQATLAVLRRHGVHVRAGSHGYRISGGQRLRRVDAAVPGDASSAAYLWAGAALTGGRVQVRGIPSSWPQADLAILALLRRYGAEVSRRGDAVTVEGGRRRPLRCTLTDSPDLYPLVGVLAAAAPGRSYLLGAEHVAAKESDRKQETMRLVRAMGARVEKIRGGLVVEGTAQTRPLRLRGVVDHRIVMSAAVGALLAPNPSELSDAGSVGKSFPGFFDALGQLGAEVSVR